MLFECNNNISIRTVLAVSKSVIAACFFVLFVFVVFSASGSRCIPAAVSRMEHMGTIDVV